METTGKQVLREAISKFFDIEELKYKAMKDAADNYVYEHDQTITNNIMEKLEIGLEEAFDDILDEVIEGLLWD